MAKPHSYNRNSSGSSRSETRPAILASCYIVDARSTLLKGLHYSTTGAGGKRLDLPRRILLSAYSGSKNTADGSTTIGAQWYS